MDMPNESLIVPALAGADGDTLITEDLVDDLLTDAVIEPVEALAASWPLRSGPFFTSDGQMAACFAEAFTGCD